MATSRDEKRLRAVWEGWHTISPPMQQGLRALRRAVEQGRARSSASPTPARCGARSTTCRPTTSRRSWIGCGIRCGRCISSCTRTCGMKLHEKYGDVVPANGPIPAYLLGNIWAQDWSNIYPLVAPAERRPGLLAHRHPEAAQDAARSTWCKTGERFYTSLGFAPLPKTFWERSLFVRPHDRDVVCHASAWDIDYDDGRAHQDVHRADRRGLHDDPPRARPQLLPARLQGAAGASSATARTTASTKRSATRSRCRSRRNTW